MPKESTGLIPHATATQDRCDCRDAWVKTLLALAAEDDRIVAVVNVSIGSSKLAAFQMAYPERLINVEMTGQVMVGGSAGFNVKLVGPSPATPTARAPAHLIWRLGLVLGRFRISC